MAKEKSRYCYETNVIFSPQLTTFASVVALTRTYNAAYLIVFSDANIKFSKPVSKVLFGITYFIFVDAI